MKTRGFSHRGRVDTHALQSRSKLCGERTRRRFQPAERIEVPLESLRLLSLPKALSAKREGHKRLVQHRSRKRKPNDKKGQSGRAFGLTWIQWIVCVCAQHPRSGMSHGPHGELFFFLIQREPAMVSGSENFSPFFDADILKKCALIP